MTCFLCRLRLKSECGLAWTRWCAWLEIGGHRVGEAIVDSLHNSVETLLPNITPGGNPVKGNPKQMFLFSKVLMVLKQ